MGHGSVMLRCCYVHGRGGVGWGMVASCSCYVAATLMRPLGYIFICKYICIYMQAPDKTLSVHTIVIYNENTEKTPDCQHLQFSTHCQFIANTSTK